MNDMDPRNDMSHRGPAQRSHPEAEPPEPRKKKSKFPPIFMTLGLGVMIFVLFYFSDTSPRPPSGEMNGSEIQLFDQSLWRDTLTTSLTLYINVKTTGYNLDRGTVERAEAAAYYGDALTSLAAIRVKLVERGEKEQRGDAPAYTQAGCAYLDALREVIAAVQTEARKGEDTKRLNFDAFEDAIKTCNTRVDELRETRIAFLTPAMKEDQLNQMIEEMDDRLRGVK